MILIVAMFPKFGQAQSKINKPSQVKVTPTYSDARSWAMLTTGQVYTFTSDSFSKYQTCWYWGLKDTLEKVINGSNNQPPNMSCAGMNRLSLNKTLSNSDSGRLVFTGFTAYKYVTYYSNGSYVTASIPVRLTVNLTDTANNFKSFARFDSGYFYRADKNFKVRLLLESFGPSDALNCGNFGSCGKWVPSIKLFDYMNTDPNTSICTSLDINQFWEVKTKVTTENFGPYCEGQDIRIKANSNSNGFWITSTDTLGSHQDTILTNIDKDTKFSFVAVGKYGCLDTSSTFITVNPKPDIQFSINDSTQCLTDNSFEFKNNSSITRGSFKPLWLVSKGINYTDTQSNLKYSFSNHGDFNVKLVCSSEKNCIDSLEKSVTVYSMPKFVIRIDTTCVGDSTLCKLEMNPTNDSVTSSLWNFSDGYTSNLPETRHKFTTSGFNKITATVETIYGCLVTDSMNHPVYSIPKTDFSTQPVSNFCAGDTIQFYSTSTNEFGVIKSYDWNFGDATNSSNSAVKKAYSYGKTKTYNVRLMVMGQGNCSDSIVKTVDIEELPRTCFLNVKANYEYSFHGVRLEPSDSFGQLGGQNGVEYIFIFENGDSIRKMSPFAFVDYALPGDGKYRFRMIARSLLGAKCSCESEWTPFTMNRLNTGNPNKTRVVVYPNPVNTSLTIETEFETSSNLTVTDLTGKIILKDSILNKSHQLEVATLNPGIYLLEIQNGTEKMVIKFIKN